MKNRFDYTKVRFVCDGDASTAKLYDTETGEDITEKLKVCKLTIVLVPSKSPVAIIEEYKNATDINFEFEKPVCVQENPNVDVTAFANDDDLKGVEIERGQKAEIDSEPGR